MELVDYLFVDSRRLDSYIEQIGPPVSYDKVPVWKAEIGLTGPRAEATQQRYPRVLTQHEKVVKLLDHLGEGISEHRAYDRRCLKGFVLEICTATRIAIPAKPEHKSSFKGLTLWISLKPSTYTAQDIYRSAGLLCLLEDYWGSDPSIHDRDSSLSFEQSIQHTVVTST